MSDNQTPAPEETPEPETVSKEQYDKLVDEHATITQDKSNLVDEIKNIRKQKTEAEEALVAKEAETTPPAPAEGEDLNAETVAQVAGETVKRILTEKAEIDARLNKESSLSEFKLDHKEFHPDNDPAGIKFAALEAKIKMFNLNNAQSISDFDNILTSAYALLKKEDSSPDEEVTPQPVDPGSGGDQPVEVDSTNLTEKELRVIRTTYDGDKEAYLKARAKRPDYVARLIELSTV